MASTAIALVVLALVLRFLPRGARNAQAHASTPTVAAAPSDLQFSNLQISSAPGGEPLYVDGLVTNAGRATLTGATAEVDFRDSQGNLVASVEKPLVGMAHGGTDLVRNEFARNPITPQEMRFFRVAVEKVPAAWNHEIPALRIVAVNSR
jgi:hypothetical protein